MKLSSLEYATKPSPDAVRRSQFRSPHRQYIDKKTLAAKRETNEVKDLNNWSISHPAGESTLETTPRGELKVKQCYTYQTKDGCLIMHERDGRADYNTICPLEDNQNLDLNSTSNNQTGQEHTVHWQDIASVDLSDTKKRDPNNFTVLSGDCSSKKKILCWNEDDDSSGSDEDEDHQSPMPY